MKQDSELSVFAFPITPPHPAIDEEKLELFESTSTATAKAVAAAAAAMAMAMAAPGRLAGRARTE